MSTLDAPRFRAMVAAACRGLEAARPTVDALNVFPVPDADTGGNMLATLRAAHAALQAEPAERLDQLAETAARGALFGAQGNSGLILSQFLAGLAQGLSGASEADARQLAQALTQAARLCREAVEAPREGTILTVAQRAADAAQQSVQSGLRECGPLLEAAWRGAQAALAESPDQIFSLAGRRVQDAGGLGLCLILQAFADPQQAADGPPEPNAASAQAAASVPTGRVGIVCDSGADLPPELQQELGIEVVALHVHLGAETFAADASLPAARFYAALRQGIVPKTAAPAPGAFIAAYSALAERCDAILSLHISGKLSSTVAVARAAARQVEGAHSGQLAIRVIDSESASMGCGLLAVGAARLARQGATLEALSQWVETARTRLRVAGVVDSLRYLELNGRIGKAKSLVGSLLHLKPVITLVGGEVAPVRAARGTEQAVESCVEEVLAGLPEGPCEAALLVSDRPEVAEALQAALSRRRAPVRCHRATLGPTIGTHIGPGAFGVAILVEPTA